MACSWVREDLCWKQTGPSLWSTELVEWSCKHQRSLYGGPRLDSSPCQRSVEEFSRDDSYSDRGDLSPSFDKNLKVNCPIRDRQIGTSQQVISNSITDEASVFAVCVNDWAAMSVG